MKIKVRGIRDPGLIGKERVVIDALEDGDIGSQILASTRRTPGGVSSKIFSPFWIPDATVKKGDVIVVYTKAGEKNSRENADKSNSYFFYIGSNEPLYTDSEVTAVVFSVERWKVAPTPAALE